MYHKVSHIIVPLSPYISDIDNMPCLALCVGYSYLDPEFGTRTGNVVMKGTFSYFLDLTLALES